MSDHDETPEVVEAPAPADPPEVEDEDLEAADEGQADEAPGRHSVSAGFGVTDKFSTTSRGDQ